MYECILQKKRAVGDLADRTVKSRAIDGKLQ